jgi:hypothetical protein
VILLIFVILSDELTKTFQRSHDFRVKSRCLHELSDILIIVLLGTFKAQLPCYQQINKDHARGEKRVVYATKREDDLDAGDD